MLEGEEAEGGERNERKENKLRVFKKIKYNRSYLIMWKMDGRASCLDKIKS